MDEVVVIPLRVRDEVLGELVALEATVWIAPEGVALPEAAGREVLRYSTAPDIRFQIPELAAAFRAAEVIKGLGSRINTVHAPAAEGILYFVNRSQMRCVLHGEPTKFADHWVDRARAILLHMEAGPEARPAKLSRERITISAVVPVYNLHQFLNEALDSLFAQTRPVDEILIVDDGSDDAQTRNALRALEATEKRVKVVRKPHSGLAATRNFGIAQATSSHILTLDADDCLRPTFVEEAVKRLESDSSLALVTSLVSCFTESVDEATGGWCPLGFDGNMAVVYNFVSCATAIMPRNVLMEVGAYDESFPAYEDWELYCRLMRRGASAVIPEFLIDVRIRGDSMLRRLPRAMHETLRARIMERHADLASDPGLAMRLLQSEYVDFYSGAIVDPSERAREMIQSQLRYRLADAVNDGLKKLGVQKVIKKAGEEWSQRT